MSFEKLIRDVLGELPDEAAEFVRARIRWEVRPRPTAEDIARGATPQDMGLFVGYPVRSEEDDEGGELFEDEDGDGIGHAEGEHELWAEEGDDVAEVPTYRPGGVIVLFTENIKPITRARVTDVVLHELGHFLGETEEGNDALGLG